MKIKVKSNFRQNETVVETEKDTLGGLLDQLSTEYHQLGFDEFFDSPSREVYPDCEVFLNSRPYKTLWQGLDTRLKEGDRLEIRLIILAGG